MKCPHCNEEISGPACSRCGAIAPEGANFCMVCGADLRQKSEGLEPEDQGELDFEDRVLCPDGTCTGIIVDGKCTECGRSVSETETS